MYVVTSIGGPGTVPVIDTTTNTVIGSPIPAGISPFGIAYDPIHQDMYVTNQDDGTVSVIDTTTNTVVDTITVGEGPIGIAYDPVNHRMYVANLSSRTVSVINLLEPASTSTTFSSFLH